MTALHLAIAIAAVLLALTGACVAVVLVKVEGGPARSRRLLAWAAATRNRDFLSWCPLAARGRHSARGLRAAVR